MTTKKLSCVYDCMKISGKTESICKKECKKIKEENRNFESKFLSEEIENKKIHSLPKHYPIFPFI